MLERIEQYGLTQEDMNLIRSNPSAYPAITKLISDVVSSSGVGQWTDRDGNVREDSINQALNYAYEGLWQGIGQSKQVAQRDAGYITPYQRWQMARQAENDKFNNLLKLKKPDLLTQMALLKTKMTYATVCICRFQVMLIRKLRKLVEGSLIVTLTKYKKS